MDVRIGASVQQHSGNVDGPALGSHVQGRVIAVPHHALGIEIDAVLDQPRTASAFFSLTAR
jgi:hypothetical protein